MVEAALILPIFFMVVLGIVEFGRAFMICQSLQNAAREGCRQAVTGSYTTAQVISNIKSEMQTAGVKDTISLNISVIVTVYTGNPAVANNEVANATTRDLVNVNVGISFAQVALVPGNYLGNMMLYGKSAMRHE
ncbi:MAG: Flp pilus assembly protein [Planctomycetaceae bacterium]|nr:Flp pilus assembly protein [Planctomycetaceae bacterium]